MWILKVLPQIFKFLYSDLCCFLDKQGIFKAVKKNQTVETWVVVPPPVGDVCKSFCVTIVNVHGPA